MVRRVPASLLLAARDLALVAVAGFLLGLLVTGPAFRQELAAFADEYGYETSTWSWGMAVEPVWDWLGAVMIWAFACWVASRARAGTPTAWLPAAVAVGGVALRSAVAVLGGGAWTTAIQPPWGRREWVFDWPGPAIPLYTHQDGSVTLISGAAAWAYPPLVAALLLAACLLGARAGRVPDDAAAHAVRPVERAGVAVAAVVVGLPALGAAAGAALAYASTQRARWVEPDDPLLGVLHDYALPLAAALVAAWLLSGTGPLGALATFAVALPAVAGPLSVWARGWLSDGALGQAAGAAVAVLAVALWRPCARWGGEVLAPVRVPPVPPALPDEPAA